MRRIREAYTAEGRGMCEQRCRFESTLGLHFVVANGKTNPIRYSYLDLSVCLTD